MSQSAEDQAFLQALGQRLRLMRARRGMTRRMLAAQSGVSERYISAVEGGTGNGSIKAMLAAKGYAIGVDTDQSLSLPEYAGALLTSAQKVIDVAALDTFKKNAGGDLGGENYLGTLANGGVGIAPFHDLDSVVPAEVKTEVDQLKADIASGAVKVSDYLK